MNGISNRREFQHICSQHASRGLVISDFQNASADLLRSVGDTHSRHAVSSLVSFPNRSSLQCESKFFCIIVAD